MSYVLSEGLSMVPASRNCTLKNMIMTVFPIQWTFIPGDIKMYFGKHRVFGQICLKSTKLNEIYFFSTELLRVYIICRLSYLFFLAWALPINL